MTGGKPRIWSERRGKWFLSLYPPWFLQGIRMVEISDGYKRARVRVRPTLLTRNLNWTIFGGTIFAAADPVYAVLLWQVFSRRGRRVRVWLHSASIRYRKPAATKLNIDFAIEEEMVDRIERALESDGKFVGEFSVEAIDRDGDVCATVTTNVFVGLPKGRPDEHPTEIP